MPQTPCCIGIISPLPQAHTLAAYLLSSNHHVLTTPTSFPTYPAPPAGLEFVSSDVTLTNRADVILCLVPSQSLSVAKRVAYAFTYAFRAPTRPPLVYVDLSAPSAEVARAVSIVFEPALGGEKLLFLDGALMESPDVAGARKLLVSGDAAYREFVEAGVKIGGVPISWVGDLGVASAVGNCWRGFEAGLTAILLQTLTTASRSDVLQQFLMTVPENLLTGVLRLSGAKVWGDADLKAFTETFSESLDVFTPVGNFRRWLVQEGINSEGDYGEAISAISEGLDRSKEVGEDINVDMTCVGGEEEFEEEEGAGKGDWPWV
ncbi:hypothetical protein RUND412_004501 [Rhizina undulata]